MSRHFLLMLTTALVFASSAMAVQKNWNNPAGGDWFEPTNWTPPGFPSYFDDVYITLQGNYVVYVEGGDANVGSLHLGGESVTTQELLVTDGSLTVTWSSTIDVSGQLHLTDNGYFYMSSGTAIASLYSVDNYGTVLVDSTSAIYLSELFADVVFTNQGMGNVVFHGPSLIDSDIQYTEGADPGSYFENYGTVTKIGGGVLQINTAFYNRHGATFNVNGGSVLAWFLENDGYMSIHPGATYNIDEYSPDFRSLHVDTMGTVEMFGSATILSISPNSRTVNNGDIIHTGTGTGIIDCEFEQEYLGQFGPEQGDMGDIWVNEGVLWFRNSHNLTFKDTVAVGPQAELRVDGNGEFITGCELINLVPDSGVVTLRQPAFHFLYFLTIDFTGELNLFGPGEVNFYQATLLDTIGVLRADSGITVNSDPGTILYAREFDLNNAIVNATVIVVEQQNWTSGSLGDGSGDSVTIDEGGTLDVSGPDPKDIDGTTLVVQGTANVGGSGEITVNNGNIVVEPGGTLTVGDSVTITSPSDTLINTGEMYINSPLDTSVFNIFVYNYNPNARTPGTIDILGKAKTTGGVKNDGAMLVEPSSDLYVSNYFENGGQLVIEGGSALNLDGTLINNGSGTIDMNGDADITGGGDIENGGQVNVNGVAVSSLTNRMIAPTITNFADSGFIDVFMDTLTLAGGGINYGDIELHNGAVLVILGNFENASTGLIHGNGTLDISGATFVNNGTISPGASPGNLIVEGDLTLGGTSQLMMEIGGRVPGQEFDRIQVNGILTVGGKLVLSILNGFVPSEDDTLELLTYDQAAGDFEEIEGARLPDGRFLDISFGPNGLKNFICTQEPEFDADLSAIEVTVPYGATAEHSVDICNTGLCWLSWSPAWIQDSPVSPVWMGFAGAAEAHTGGCASLLLEFDAAGLSPGTYQGQVELMTNDADEGLVRIPVTLIVDDDPLPVELISFTATPDYNRVVLSWSTGAEADLSHFEIERGGEQRASIEAVNSASGHNYSWIDGEVSTEETYSYSLISVDMDGTRRSLGTVEARPLRQVLPTELYLSQNYPNPFNATTTIQYYLPEASKMTLTLYNIAGQEIVTLADGLQSAGMHTVSYDAVDLPSGVYFYQLRSPAQSLMKKMVLLK
ncbi:MAG: T9SS type A sorting domain-containing protein [Calditrichaeota bacterium]|nr:T9SS type A sorting domain-containing protein [Calditrichota bacterium]MCB9367635.1 T9SS type A sorting domain-containing protein [Calditrichota bacterium]